MVDGVPVFWQEVAGPLSAGLVFGCGARDETFMTVGVTHLVEHLVMAALPRLHHEHNAGVDLTTTRFTATGRPEQVVAFLSGVCAALSDLPLGRLEQEAGVLEAEGGFAAHPTGAVLLTRRFGARDVGLETFVGPGVEEITPDAVLAHAARYFVAGNAALWLTGPVPEGLRLPLPPGDRARRVEPVALPQRGPRWSAELVPSSGLLLSAPHDLAGDLGMAILRQRVLREARLGRGLSYEVFGDVYRTGPLARHYLLGADAREGHDGTVAEILWRHATRLAVEGPGDEELDEERAGLLETVIDPRWEAEELLERVEAELFGVPFLDADTVATLVGQVTTRDVGRFFADALPTALLVVPEGEDPHLPGMLPGGCPRTTRVPAAREFRMKPLVRLIGRHLHPPRYYLTATGVAMRDADGGIHEMAFADVVGVHVYSKELFLLHGADGCVVPLAHVAYQDGEVLRSAIDRRVPPGLRFGAGAATSGAAPDGLVDTLASFGDGRPGWYRLLALGGVLLFSLCTLILYVNWRLGTLPLWWAVVAGLLTLCSAWETRPPRRPRMTGAPEDDPSTADAG